MGLNLIDLTQMKPSEFKISLSEIQKKKTAKYY